MISKRDIDSGRGFDWGRTSEDYAKYRDIYPDEFYRKINELGLCIKGQKVLDIGTGTGVLPLNMFKYGAEFTGADIAENQINQARILSEQANMNIEYRCCPVEELDFSDNSFDVITACQCFIYFDHDILAEKAAKMLRTGGRMAVLHMNWLPLEDKIAGESEKLILKYNPVWTGCNETRHMWDIPKVYNKYFNIVHEEMFDLKVPFTRKSWNGRIKACRGIGASLSEPEIESFENEHKALLESIAPESFDILHYAAITILELK